MHGIATKLSVEVYGCDYMWAHMVAKETLYFVEKYGYKVMAEIKGVDQLELTNIHQLQEVVNGDLVIPEPLKTRINEYRAYFGEGQEPR